MKKFLFICICIFFLHPHISLSSPKIQFSDLLIRTEQNPELVKNAQREAVRYNQPVSIVTKDQLMITAMGVENGKPVYTVITNFADLYDGGYTAFYNEVVGKINFSNARVDYGNGRVVDNTNGFFQPALRGILSTKVLMVPESGKDRVMIFDSYSGDLIDSNFIPPSPDQFSTPIHALQHFNGIDILVSDQLDDVVQEFNQTGIYKTVFAPAGGVNNAILDNVRGMGYRPNNNLLVTVGSGLSTNTVQEFDAAGNPLGAFISSGLTSPFAILSLPNYILVSCSSAPNDISKYDLNGNFLSVFHSSTSLNFAEQMIRLGNGDIVVAGFSLPSGLVILDSAGAYKRTLNVVTGNRGVYLLGNGHYLTTSGTSIYELDSASGAIIRNLVTNLGFSFRFISEYNFTDPTLKLTVNLESCPLQQEFRIELRNSVSPYALIDSQTVTAGSGIPASVSFPAASSGPDYYIVVKGKNSLPTWSSIPESFQSNYLMYNFTDSASKAYGNNMTDVGGVWSLYQGNIDGDEFIDLTDVSLVYNDASIFLTGNAVTDLNCDGFVDLTDIIVVFTNSSDFIHVIKP